MSQILFLFFLAILPFGFALNPVPGVDLPIIRVIIPLLFLIWIFESLVKKNLRFDTRFRFFLIILLLCLVSFSLSWALNPSFGTRKALFLISVFPIYFVSFSLTKDHQAKTKILSVLVWSGFFLAFFAIIQFSAQFVIGIDNTLSLLSWYLPFFLGETLSGLVISFPSWMVNVSGKTIVRAFSPFPDPHVFSLYINLILPIALYLFHSTKKRIYLYFSFVLLLASLLSFSRASYLALSFAVIFFLLSKFGKKFVQKYFLLFLAIVLFLLFVAIIPNPLTTRLISSLDVNEGSNSGRMLMWKKASEGIVENPLGGVGIGNFSYYLEPTVSLRNPVYAHNAFLDIGVETGFFTAFLFLLILLAPIVAYFRKKIPLNLAISICFVIFSIHCFFETPLFSIHVLPLFYILLSIKTDE